MSTMIIDYDDNEDDVDDDVTDYVLTMLMMVIMLNVPFSVFVCRFGSIGGMDFGRIRCHLCCDKSNCLVTKRFKHAEF